MKHTYLPKLSKVFVAFAALVLALGTPAIVSASCSNPNQDSCSSSYGVSQTHFGSGGQVNACSSGPKGYCADESAGDLADGNSASTNYQTQAGSGLTTHRDPFIEVIVGDAPTDLGTLSVGGASTTTASFTVKTYLASGYQVQIVGTPPTSTGLGAHTFNPISSSPDISRPGTEQFGINLRANTSPTNFGADPTCSPDSTFCPASTQVASIASHYSTAGKYYYPAGPGYTDTLAAANTSTGTVSYTISFIYNISNLTPDGQYTYNGDIVATSTF